MPRIYLDNNATTPVLPEVVEAVAAALRTFGNPSSSHGAGRAARALLGEARARLAELLAVDAREIHFTSGGTEADNLAVLGGARAAVAEGAGRHVVISAVEHPAVTAAAARLAAEGFRVDVVPVDGDGVVQPEAVERAAGRDTALVALILVQNETGVRQPVAECLRAARGRSPGARLHVDAVQALGKDPVHPRALGADTVAVSAHKIHGPKGAGALWVAPGRAPRPRAAGGSQESGLRTGTENVSGIVGFGCAAAAALRDAALRGDRFQRVGSILERGLLALPGARRNGPAAPLRHPGTVNVSFAGLRGDLLLMALDGDGVEVSTGSACASGAPVPSSVLKAMGLDDERAREAVRVSASALTTEDEATRAVGLFAAAVERLRGPGAAPGMRGLRANPSP